MQDDDEDEDEDDDDDNDDDVVLGTSSMWSWASFFRIKGSRRLYQ